jgi:alpha-tubulin suppressor-like RCC1 family protein
MTAPPITTSTHRRRPHTLILVTGLLAALLLSLTGAPATATATATQTTTTWAWGNNGAGQLGNDSTTNSSTPVTVADLDDQDVMALAAGDAHSMALLADGTVRTWGQNGSGQLGNGTTIDSRTPVAVTALAGTKVVAIAADGSHSMALLHDGTVLAWGNNGFGQLGIGNLDSSSTPVAVTALPDDRKVVAIAAGAGHNMALLDDGTVRAWGDNDYGQLGNGNTEDSTVPVTVTGLPTDVVAIAAGIHSMALHEDGTIRTWGFNRDGQLGDGTAINSSVPVTVSGLPANKEVEAVAAGHVHSVALLDDGTLWTWGANTEGQLGNGTTTIAPTTTPQSVTGLPADKKVVAVAAGHFHNVTLLDDGTVQTWGNNFFGQLGNNTTTGSSIPVTVTGLDGKTVAMVAAGRWHSLASQTSTQTTTTWAWGNNGAGQLGNDSTTNSSTPVTVADLDDQDVMALAAGDAHSMALLADGTVRTWGQNGSGQLGNGTTIDSRTPVAVTALAGTKVVAIAADGSHSMALLHDGTVLAWGNNGFGQLGIGNLDSSSTPVAVTALPDDRKVVAIAAGAGHNMALLDDGTVRAWGDNDYGQLGNGNTEDSTVPVTVTGLPTDVVAIAAGIHSMALHEDGTIRTWGFNRDGQLGDGTAINSSVPVTVSGLPANKEVEAVAAGHVHSVALLDDGTLWTWGANTEGQLGNGTTTIAPTTTPQSVTGLPADKKVVAVAAGHFHNVTLLDDGTVQTWGNNFFGQLGNNTTTGSSIPVTVTGLDGKTVAMVAAGRWHSLASQTSTSPSALLFEGFAAPVDNDGAVNVVTARATVPMRWRLTLDGVPVGDPAAITALTSKAVTCPTASVAELPVEETTTSKNGLTYQDDGYWQYNWATTKSWAGTCRQFDLTLSDDSVHTALFRFR